MDGPVHGEGIGWTVTCKELQSMAYVQVEISCVISWGLVLRPVLFNIFVSDEHSGIECTFIKSANTMLSCVVDTLKGGDTIQKYLDRLEVGSCKALEVQQGQV